MKENGVAGILICLMLVLLLNLASAGWVSDIFNKDNFKMDKITITGNSIYDGYWCNGSDITQDGNVDGGDLAMILANYNQNCSSDDWCNGSDITLDGTVNGGDLSMVLSNWNNICSGEPECTDSDGGLNYYVKGLVTSRGGDESIWDFCNGSVLTELTCDEQGGKAYYYICPNGCQNGACISNISITCYNNLGCGSPTTTRYCLGNASCTNTTIPTCFNAGTVNSYCGLTSGESCSDCYYSCENGYCIIYGNETNLTSSVETPTISGASAGFWCYDSDNGIEPYVFGSINSSLGSYKDRCLNDVSLEEYSCGNYSELDTTNFSCPCSNGKCIASEEWCNGVDITKDGSVDGDDLSLLLTNFNINQTCFGPEWCGGADIDKSGSVNGGDLSILLVEWGREDCIGTTQGFFAGIWEGIKNLFGF